ncbi:hypothetical protein L9F63_004614, partial [Diploptera punctata]
KLYHIFPMGIHFERKPFYSVASALTLPGIVQDVHELTPLHGLCSNISSASTLLFYFPGFINFFLL